MAGEKSKGDASRGVVAKESVESTIASLDLMGIGTWIDGPSM